MDKSRRKVAKNSATTTRELWELPKTVSLHWDPKLLQMLNNPNATEEQHTVLVSTQQETKLLSTPLYPSKAVGGRQVRSKVADLIMSCFNPGIVSQVMLTWCLTQQQVKLVTLQQHVLAFNSRLIMRFYGQDVDTTLER